MSGRHQHVAAPRRPGLRWLAGAGALGVSCAILLAMSPADAATHNIKAQLALSGVVTRNSPAGGTQVGVRPGDSVTFSAASVPTVGLARHGLGSLVSTVDNLLSGAAKFQVRANFSALPGGSRNTVLSGRKSVTFHFPTVHTYNFTWTVEKVTVFTDLLGNTHKNVSTIHLDGNQLRKAGIRLNAANQYVGQVVVKKHPPSGGISVQLPSVHVAPSVTGVGQLPTVGVPGVTPPTISVPAPGSVPSIPNPLQSSSPGSNGGGSHNKGSRNGVGYTPPALTIPEEVVPQGQNADVIPGGGYYVGDQPKRVPVIDVPPIPHTGNGPDHGSTSGGSHPSRTGNKAIDLATDTQNPSGGLPVVLAIIAVIALALVAGTYARLFLNRRNL